MPRMYADGGAELELLFARARSAGAVTSLDLAMPDPNGPSGRADWPGILARTLPHVELFLPSADELALLLRRPGAGVPELAEAAIGLGARLVAIKLGDRGIYLRTSDAAGSAARGTADAAGSGALWSGGPAWAGRELWVPAFAVPHVAGTTGAGDAAVAGFLAAVVRGEAPEQTVRMAAAVGACCVERADSIGGVLGWAATRDRLAAGWPAAAAEPPAAGWIRDAGGCWHGPHDA